MIKSNDHIDWLVNTAQLLYQDTVRVEGPAPTGIHSTWPLLTADITLCCGWLCTTIPCSQCNSPPGKKVVIPGVTKVGPACRGRWAGGGARWDVVSAGATSVPCHVTCIIHIKSLVPSPCTPPKLYIFIYNTMPAAICWPRKGKKVNDTLIKRSAVWAETENFCQHLIIKNVKITDNMINTEFCHYLPVEMEKKQQRESDIGRNSHLYLSL